MLTQKRLGIIGAGNMAEALILGILDSGLIPRANILACDPTEERRQRFVGHGISVGEDNMQAAACDVVLLSIKPQMMAEVLAQIGGRLGPQTLLISIAAGIRTSTIAARVAPGTRIVRVMPNTPMLVGAGMSGVCRGAGATEADVELVLEMCASSGESCEVEEDLMDAVTAVSGSGPAYVFLLTELLERAAREVGLEPELAGKLARQTVIGAATLLAESEDEAQELRRKVTSPKGTTEAAVNYMLENGLAEVIADGVRAARDRSIELSRG